MNRYFNILHSCYSYCIFSLLILSFASVRVTSGETQEWKYLPRLHYITDCGCTDLAQEAASLLTELAKYDIFGAYHGSESKGFLAYWLSINKCPSTGIEARCARHDAHTQLLLQQLSRNGELNPPVLADRLRPKIDPSRILRDLSADDDDDDDVEYGATVLDYLSQGATHSAMIVSHYDQRHPCPPTRDLSALQNRRETDTSLGQMIFGSLWPTLADKVRSLIRPADPADEAPYARPVQICRGSYPTQEIPQWEVKRCNRHCDRLLVPSRFHLDNFVASGINQSRLAVLPVAVDLEYFSPGYHKSSDRSVMSFLSVCSSSSRKNWKSSLEAYFSAFTRDDNVEYILKITSEKRGFNPKYTISMFSYGWALEHDRDVDDLPRVTMISKLYDQRKRKAMYDSADVFISTSHGESFALAAFEAMAMGLPVIAPNWSLFREILTHNQTGFLIDVPELSPSIEEYDFGQWAQPSTDSLIQLLQWVYHHPVQAAAIGENGRGYLHAHQNLQQTGAAFIEYLHSMPRNPIEKPPQDTDSPQEKPKEKKSKEKEKEKSKDKSTKPKKNPKVDSLGDSNEIL